MHSEDKYLNGSSGSEPKREEDKYLNSSFAKELKTKEDKYLNSSIELYTSASKTSSNATYEELKQQFHNEKYFTLYNETVYSSEVQAKYQIPVDAFFQLDSSKFVLKEKLSAGCFGEVYSCLYDGQELVCKITKHIDYHEILINELKEKKLAHNEDVVKYLKSNKDIKEEDISEEDYDKYLHTNKFHSVYNKNIIEFIAPYSSDLNLNIFPKYYGFFFSASLERSIMLFERLKMTLENYVRMIKTHEELVFILEEIFNAWATLYEQGVCHFDIKPDNIMLDYNHKLKLVDLGLVSFRGEFLFNGVDGRYICLPRKNVYYPLTYNDTDTNDDFAFAIMILNILLYLIKEKVLAAIGDEVVKRSNVESKLKQLGIECYKKGDSETRIRLAAFKKTILSLL